jgi:phosphoglycolate phosphatase
MKEFQVTPDEVLMIGDTDIDTLTGHNVGAWTCGVRYGFDPSRLERVPPDILVDAPGDLPLIFAPGDRPPLEAHSLRDILA